MNVLIIDDDVWMQRLLKKILLNLEVLNVDAVSNGFEGINIALHKSPNLIFLDLMMPEIDGLTTLKVLKTLPETSNINIIICSGNNNLTNIAEIIKYGANDFVAKPFTTDLIKEKLNKLIIN